LRTTNKIGFRTYGVDLRADKCFVFYSPSKEKRPDLFDPKYGAVLLL
jgi:hypothetical protein